VFAGISAWWDAVNVSTVPAATTNLIAAAFVVMIAGLIGALSSIARPRAAGLQMLIAAIASMIAMAVDFVFVPETYGLRAVGGLLLVAACLWLVAAWLTLRPTTHA
jgi:hypothetical protein